jgi:hypothetical protein
MTTEKNKELIKKTAGITLLLIVVGFVWSIYLKAPVENKTITTQKTSVKLNNEAVPKVEKTEIVVEKNLEPEIKVDEQIEPKIFKPSYIHSSDKNRLIQLAAQNVGKKDPFVNNNPKSKPTLPINTSFVNSNILSSNSTTNVLPPTGNFLNLPNIQTNFQNTDSFSEEPQLKGFIGNKAIISYKGMSRAVMQNQYFEDIKITSVNQNNLSIKYSKNGKIYIKQLNLPDNEELGIIK